MGTARPWDYYSLSAMAGLAPGGTRRSARARVPTLKHPSAGLKRWGPAAPSTARPWDYSYTWSKKKMFKYREDQARRRARPSQHTLTASGSLPPTDRPALGDINPFSPW